MIVQRNNTYKAYNNKNQYVLVTYEGKVRRKRGFVMDLVKVKRVGNYLIETRVLFNQVNENGEKEFYIEYYNQRFYLKGKPINKEGAENENYFKRR